MTNPRVPNRLAVAALVSDAEFTKLSALSEVYDLTRVEHPQQLRTLFLEGRAVGAFVGTRILQNGNFRVLISDITAQLPAHRIVGLIPAGDPPAQQALDAYGYGRAGVQKVIIVNGDLTPVRCAFDDAADQFLVTAVAKLADGLELTEGFRQFLAGIFRPDTKTSRRLGASLGVHPSTMMSRFFRVGLPSPKTYVAWARLVYAAHLGRQSGYSITAIADRLNASSPQSFGRTVRSYTGMTAAQFREQCDGESMLSAFRQKLLEPYAEQLRDFDPLREDASRPRSRAA